MLSMKSGLQIGSGKSSLPQTLADPPIGDKTFSYLGVSFILSYVILEVTGLTPGQYLAQNVLPKLGIDESEYVWNPSDLENPFAQMELTPAQMAKFGQLYLQGGKASPLDNNPPIVSKEWVDASWTASSKNIFPGVERLIDNGYTRDDLEAFVGMNVGMDHGYLFYNRPQRGNTVWCADGNGGQHICVSPSLSRVVVQVSCNVIRRGCLHCYCLVIHYLTIWLPTPLPLHSKEMGSPLMNGLLLWRQVIKQQLVMCLWTRLQIQCMV